MVVIRDKVETNTQRIVRLETKLDLLPEIKDLLEKHISNTERRFKEQDTRIDCVEKDVSFVKGRLIVVFSAITAAVSAGVGWIVNKLN